MKAIFIVAAVALVAAAWDDRGHCAYVERIDEIHDADLTSFKGVKGIPIQGGSSLVYFSLCQEVSKSCPEGAAVCYDPGTGSNTKSLGKLRTKQIDVEDDGNTVKYTFSRGSTCSDSDRRGKTTIYFHQNVIYSESCSFKFNDPCNLECHIYLDYMHLDPYIQAHN